MAKSGKTPKSGPSGKKKPGGKTAAKPAAPKPANPKAASRKKPAPAKAAPAAKATPAREAAKALPKAKSPFAPADLDHFRQKLVDRRRRILASVASLESEALKATDQDFSVDHMADHGSDNFEQDFTLALVESERRELFEIDQALERIRQGTYGVCEGTGKPIGRPRLEAIPYARYSVEYQRRIEAGEVEEEEFRPAMAVRGRRVPLHEEEGAAAEGLPGDWEKDEAKRPRGAEAEEEREPEVEREEPEEAEALPADEKMEDLDAIEEEETEEEEP
jgi:RNA polymerase-binding protein DksA